MNSLTLADDGTPKCWMGFYEGRIKISCPQSMLTEHTHETFDLIFPKDSSGNNYTGFDNIDLASIPGT